MRTPPEGSLCRVELWRDETRQRLLRQDCYSLGFGCRETGKYRALRRMDWKKFFYVVRQDTSLIWTLSVPLVCWVEESFPLPQNHEGNYKVHSGSVDQLCWHPSKKDVFSTASADKTVRLWDARCKLLFISILHLILLQWNLSIRIPLKWGHPCNKETYILLQKNSVACNLTTLE